MIRICFPQPVRNGYRYQGFIHAILDGYKKYRLIYIDQFHDRQDLPYILYFLYRASLLCKQVIGIFRSDVVFFCSMGIDYRLFKIALFLKKKIIVDFYISQYQTSVLSRKNVPINSKFAMKLLNKEFEMVEKASVIIFLNNTERDFYLNIINSSPQNSKIIPLIVSDYYQKAKLKYWKSAGKLCFCWWGGEFNPIHGLRNIIKGLKRVEEQGIQFDFYIFGYDKSQGDKYYYELLSDVGWEKKVIPRYDITFQNGGLIEFLIENCTIAFGPLSLEPKAINVITNKALDSISLGIPLLTIESPAMREYFDDNAVWYCSDNSAESISEQILLLINSSRSIINKKVMKANQILRQNFILESQKRMIYDLIDGLFI